MATRKLADGRVLVGILTDIKEISAGVKAPAEPVEKEAEPVKEEVKAEPKVQPKKKTRKKTTKK